MRKTITFDAIREALGAAPPDLPKYASGLLNRANQLAQGTRPAVVGQMTELIQEFPGKTLAEWRAWYTAQRPNALNEATDRIWSMVARLKNAMEAIDRDAVRRWTEDLVIVKTFVGLRFHEVILREVAELRGMDYRLAQPAEESRGIDGYIGGKPVSIKPKSYSTMAELPESIECEMIFYEKKGDGLVIEFKDTGIPADP